MTLMRQEEAEEEEEKKIRRENVSLSVSLPFLFNLRFVKDIFFPLS